MAKYSSPSYWLLRFYVPRGETLWFYLALVSAISLLGQELARCSALASPDPTHFEGFGEEDALESDSEEFEDGPIEILIPPPTVTQSNFETHHGPPEPSSPEPKPKPSSSSFEYWDEDEFEGLPIDPSPRTENPTENSSSPPEITQQSPSPKTLPSRSFHVEIICVSFLISFIINYFTGKRENENIALAWASCFATKDTIFDKNFSLLGTGDGKDTPLLLKEGQNIFKFYASGRRYCQGLLATMELQSRHDLLSRIYNFVVPCKDEITFEVYMNDENMDHVLFAMARKKLAKVIHKEVRDLQRYAGLLSVPMNRKWVSEELAVMSESREVASDLITEAVLDQVFGEKAFEKFGKGFISFHFSDQHAGSHRKMLVFKFSLPNANNMADMTRLVALVPYYIDLVGRYKLSSQARSKTEAARAKAAQEIYKELQNVRQEAIQRKKAERRKLMEEAEAKLSAEALRKKEEKERARQLKKTMPKVKMTRAH
ncbi:uncharacterized protein At5g49945 [Amborella trichopoda]|uniref:Coiled-coil domain-containing protein 47 n=1 Tax=Amborella trichopoda TaxID=13333 RepID=W1PMZ8_AMBTC|nr:uncharacterized protein At5g49945 [Amborella trichopoda]ERN08550.1 hypothetical protein AMTR_s00017p00075650 [Amborella trichopoda]|eukprot:XP_006846969.1 uncharacterized protein At5g49945 [Amborella trichopoda]